MTTTEHRPELETTTVDPETPGGASLRKWARSGTVAFVVLTSLYFALSLFGSPHAYLSTDVGGKTAALAAMVERGDWSTDLGYWAEGSDPDGLVYPFAFTAHTETGWWVNTTSLPMVLAARPLWALGGAQLALLIPMMAAAGAAVVAGRLQDRLHPDGGRSAMWVVGLSTPVVVYALDFWEHSLGVFLMALGTLFVLDSVDRATAAIGTSSASRAAAPALGAGVAFGLAATMRQEALVYGFAAGLCLVFGIVANQPRRLRTNLPAAVVPGLAMVGGTGLMLLGNSLAENLFYGESLRSARGSGIASSVGSDPMGRVDAMFTTVFSPINAIHPVATFFGLVILAGLIWLTVASRQGGNLRLPAGVLIAMGTILAVRMIRFGPSFIPGVVPAAPLVVPGALLGWATRKQRLLQVVALGPLPLIYLTQYSAGAVPQWGGRYMLLTGFLLVVLACVELPRIHAEAFRVLVVAGLVVTAVGVWFNASRTNSLAADFELITTVADGDVVIWYDPIKAREAGPAIIDQRWLSTVGDAERDTVLQVLDAQSIDRFVYVDPVDDEQVSFDGFEAVSPTGQWELSRILRQRLTIFERSR